MLRSCMFALTQASPYRWGCSSPRTPLQADQAPGGCWWRVVGLAFCGMLTPRHLSQPVTPVYGLLWANTMLIFCIGLV